MVRGSGDSHRLRGYQADKTDGTERGRKGREEMKERRREEQGQKGHRTWGGVLPVTSQHRCRL